VQLKSDAKELFEKFDCSPVVRNVRFRNLHRVIIGPDAFE